MNQLHRRHFLLASIAAAVGTTDAKPRDGKFSVGLMADAQYADVPPKGSRFYRDSIAKLGKAVAAFNQADVALCIHLGDLIDRDWESFTPALDALSPLRPACLHLLGNHDYSVDESHLSQIPNRLSIRENYFSTTLGSYRLVCLDTNEISTYAHPPGTPPHTSALKKLTELKKKQVPNAQSWNGAIPGSQLAWLDAQCSEAATAGQRVAIFAHHPVFPSNAHNLWNDSEVLATIDRHQNVAAWFNGHNHAGAYATRKGVHYVTLHGMVETADSSAFAIATFGGATIELSGYGREPTRSLHLSG